MSEKRRDNRNRILREGEYQRKDGRYRFRYIDEDGKEKNVYSWRLDKNDPMPKGIHTRCEGKSLFQSSTHQEVFYYEKL